jgi:hypothetical protein
MQQLRAFTYLAVFSVAFIFVSTARANQSLFVFVPHADSPGNDYSKIEHSSFEECQTSCETDTACNAFTYNQAQKVCFLKRAASQWTTFYAWGITGIKLSPLAPSE